VREGQCAVDPHALYTSIKRWQRLARHIQTARLRQWPGALTRLKTELQFALRNLQIELDATKRSIGQRDESAIASMKDLLADLEQLEDEFGGGCWTFDGPTGVLSVTTEPITLEDIELGPFAIRLTTSRLSDVNHQRAYSIEALEPNPAEGSSNVSHPHVSDEILCEGDASSAIKSALEQGRIADFFLLVRSVLTTYNPGSPYVALDRWHGGTSCHDCGNHVSDDGRSYCERCSDEFCSNCTWMCESCHSYFCGRCSVTCQCCDESCCTGCISVCSACHSSTCESCLEDGTCTNCRERNPNESEDESDDESTSGSVAAIEHDGEGTRGGGDNEEEENCDSEDFRLPDAGEEEEHPGADPAILALCLGEAARVS